MPPRRAFLFSGLHGPKPKKLIGASRGAGSAGVKGDYSGKRGMNPAATNRPQSLVARERSAEPLFGSSKGGGPYHEALRPMEGAEPWEGQIRWRYTRRPSHQTSLAGLQPHHSVVELPSSSLAIVSPEPGKVRALARGVCVISALSAGYRPCTASQWGTMVLSGKRAGYGGSPGALVVGLTDLSLAIQ